MNNKNILDIIIFLTNEMKKNNHHINNIDSYEITFGGAKYILSQLLRQLKLPPSNYLVTIEADKLWNEIRYEDTLLTTELSYSSKVVVQKDCEISLDRYRGASSTPEDKKLILKQGSHFKYNDVFHDDHIIPIKNIVEELYNLNDVNYQNVQNILNKITICKMLKQEDRNLKNKTANRDSVIGVIKNIYNTKGVYIK